MDTILQELRRREPAFHQVELCATREQLERYTDPDFWDAGGLGAGVTR